MVENAFGRLKGRWRWLLKRNDAQLQHIPPVIAACVTLHNILCEIHKEHFYDEWLTSNHNDTLPATEQHNTIHRSDPTAEAIRETLRDYVIAHPLQCSRQNFEIGGCRGAEFKTLVSNPAYILR